MRRLYELVNDTLSNINFNELWTGFTKMEFALYDKNNVYFAEKTIPYDNRFLGNTSIKYEDKNLSIWNIDNEEGTDYKELSSNIVHEMFHSYQFSQNETRFPNDIEGLSYPNTLENYQLKFNENLSLVAGLNSKDINEKIKLLKQIIASRKFRVEKFGQIINYEFMIETTEGSAEYCGTKALKLISSDLYKKHIEDYKKIIVEDEKILFNIRKCCYFTGTLFLLLLDEIGIEFSKKISNQELTIFQQVSNLISTDNVDLITTNTLSLISSNSLMIEKNFTKDKSRKENLLKDFFSKNPITHEGEFQICGYDPMNMFKLHDKILCSNFIMLQNTETKEHIFVKGPVVLIAEKDLDSIKSYYALS